MEKDQGILSKMDRIEKVSPERSDKRGKVLQKTNEKNRQVQRTRKWIFEALMLLMDEKPYGKISISDITAKAGVARQTFYRNYDDKNAVILQYLVDTLNTDLFKAENSRGKNRKNDIILTYNIKYMIEHRSILKKIILNTEVENIIVPRLQQWQNELIDQYKGKLPREDYLLYRYKVRYQLVGCMNVILDWFINDMPLPIEKLNTFLKNSAIPFDAHRNIPDIVVRIGNE
jgi:AcrR family transcriptional regulator